MTRLLLARILHPVVAAACHMCGGGGTYPGGKRCGVCNGTGQCPGGR